MTDHVLLLCSLATVAGLITLAAAVGRGRLARPRVAAALWFTLLLAYGAGMAWGWARRAADFERSTRVGRTSR